MHELIWLVPALPLLGVLINGLLGSRLSPRAISVVGCGVVGLAALAALGLFAELTALPPHTRVLRQVLYTWIASGNFRAEVALLVDPLSAVMLLVVTGVGFLIHVYSVGYMHGDRGYARYFTYLNLFTFSMLVLVLADNFLLLYVGWEGVGLCSYLLIGFWYERDSAANAGKKAFITTRIGDVGFAVGIFLVFATFGTVNIREVFDAAGRLPVGDAALTAITLLLFLGAVGKSAQLPLHVWLPDAMEGPTPVSALIHAATMVTAGVYLVARLSLLYALAPVSLAVVAAVGGITAVFAASIGLTQNDIKRVLAYSTLSQLGYMFAALGVGAWTAAIFHLMTHGFFKGLLFLGSGSVIHAVHEEQDMRKMGGLAKKIPHTYWTMLIGAVAIAGIPPLAGFFSKDEILGEAYKLGFLWVWAIGVVVAIMTAFYMFRLIGLTFWGESRVDTAVEPRIHESPRVMTVPLWLLAIPSIVLGLFLAWPGPPLGSLFGMEGPGLLAGWLEPVYEHGFELLGHHEAEFAIFGIDGVLILISVAVALGGMLAAWRLFGVEIGPLQRRGAPAQVNRASLNKWWFDDLNHLVFIVIGGRVAAFAWWFDAKVVDGIVNGIGAVTRRSGGGLARVQTGHVQNYALGIAVGLIVMAGSYLMIAGR
ncbi:MAG: NADH-quinone oxidoreductase subunit L [Deltaproteobacteria bacterium]|nr:NADH-quinone oxidoreductase subunit L [Deltaproteobacteria bacterium]